jgi:transposase
MGLAKSRFELAVADRRYRIQRCARLTRALQAQGHQVQLLPAQYVRACVKRNKNDAADAGALPEASRCAEIRAEPVKSVE